MNMASEIMKEVEPPCFENTIAYNLGLRIDHMAMVDFSGFSRIVDTLRGVDVPVACPYTDWRLIDPSYDLNDPNNWAEYCLKTRVFMISIPRDLWVYIPTVGMDRINTAYEYGIGNYPWSRLTSRYDCLQSWPPH